MDGRTEYGLKFFKSIDGRLEQVGTGNWHGPFPFLALQRAAELARDLLADAFEITTPPTPTNPRGDTRRFSIGRNATYVQVRA